MSQPNTPRRKSARHLPQVDVAASAIGRSDIVLTDHLHTRPARIEDLTGIDDQEFTSIDDCETYFYRSFTRNSDRATRAPIKTYGKSSRKRKSDVGTSTVLSVGDTVLVQTKQQNNSIGVITAIWKVEGGEMTKEQVRVQVHWFLRPEELPKFRVKKEFFEVSAFLRTIFTLLHPSFQPLT